MTTTTKKNKALGIEDVLAAAESAVRTLLVVPDDFPMGGAVRQGDVLLVRVPDDHPRGAAQNSQVVTGTSRGSRHVAELPARCFQGIEPPTVRTRKGALVGLTKRTAFLGALVESPDRYLLSHPEHGHHSLPGGCWQVVQQADLRMRRAMED